MSKKRAGRIREAAWPAILITGAILVAGLTAAPGGDGGDDAAHRNAMEAWVAAHRSEILADLTDWLTIPNSAIDLAAMRRNAEHLSAQLERRGAATRLLETGESGPYVYAVLEPEGEPAPGGPPTVLFYCHYDGQPVDPARWTVGPPHEPTLVGDPGDPEARLYARSAADDKSPITALLAAVDGLRETGIPPNIRVKFIFDPEEEIGSPHLRAILEEHADLLAADLMIFADGPVYQTGQPTVVFGTRGIVTVSLTVYGPATHLHSGHYGNWAPNPAEKLAALLASMKDGDGRVLVEGFYDDVAPLGAADRRAISEITPVEENLKETLLVARPDGGGRSLQELINLPSLNVRGLRSAWVGDDARTIVPSSATAEIDMRLVKGVTPDSQVERLRRHIEKQGFLVVDREPADEIRRRHPLVVKMTHSGGVPASRTPLDLPLSRSVIAAVRRAAGEELVLMPTLGGTGPLSLFEEILGLPVYAVPIVNPDNNQHGPDENLRLGNFWKGIVVYASLLRLSPPAAE